MKKYLLMALSLLALIGCNAERDMDYFAELQSLGTCDNQFAKPTIPVDLTATLDQVGEPFISDECFEDIRNLFNYDQSFLDLPEIDQKRILESAVYLYNYDLTLPPKGGIFSKAVPNQGTIPLSFLCMADPNLSKDCPNYSKKKLSMRKMVFNYTMNNIDKLYYNAKATENYNAQYMFDDFLLNGKVTFSRLFLQYTPIGINNSRTPYIRATTFFHEARHRELIHDLDEISDQEMNGAYGFGAVYLAALLFANYNKVHPVTGEYLLSDYDIQYISGEICYSIDANVHYTNPALKKWVDKIGCWGPDHPNGVKRNMWEFLYYPDQGHSAKWWLAQHGLSRD